jgi:hypothetical protein
MEVPVQDRHRDGRVFEDCAPFGDPSVGGQDHGAVRVAAGDDLEQVGAGFAGHRPVAELVNDQDLWSGPESHRVLPPSLVGRAAGAGHEVGGGRVVHPVASLDGFESECDREHRLANRWRPDQQEIGLLLDEPQGRELVDELAVDAGLGGEVELFERLGR